MPPARMSTNVRARLCAASCVSTPRGRTTAPASRGTPWNQEAATARSPVRRTGDTVAVLAGLQQAKPDAVLNLQVTPTC